MNSSTAQRILERAQALMVERGYNAFSYADIAEEVRVTKATIHFHFATKAKLAEHVVRGYREEAVAGLRQLSEQVPDAPARLEAYARYWETCIRGHKPLCLCALLGGEILTLPEPVKSEVQAFFRDVEGWLAGALDEGARQGTLQRGRGPALEAKSLLAVVYGAMLAARIFGDAKAFAAVVGEAIGRLKTSAATSTRAAGKKRAQAAGAR
ncbi:MAG: TetR/AcrR family transcriptional regulator [Nevskia sp.]|nr:TetR/AcrR family transcriptional regulator [Nevskia sp.]